MEFGSPVDNTWSLKGALLDALVALVVFLRAGYCCVKVKCSANGVVKPIVHLVHRVSLGLHVVQISRSQVKWLVDLIMSLFCLR